MTTELKQPASRQGIKPDVNSRQRAVALPEQAKRRSAALRIWLTCWLVFALHFATNTVREVYPALSLGDHLSFDVSEYLGLHPDIFAIPGRGAYINNNPGASILGAVPYTLARPAIDWIVDRVQAKRQVENASPPTYDTIYPMAQQFLREAFSRGYDVKFGLAAGVMQVGLMAPLSALSAVVMYIVLSSLLRSERAAIWLALLYAFATPVFYRTGQLNHNLLEAHFAFFAFVLLWRPWDDPARPRQPQYLLAGLLAGWTVVLDYSGVIAVAALCGYAFLRWVKTVAEFGDASRQSVAGLVRFGVGVMVSVGILLAYQWVNFGHPLYPAQHYMPATTYSGYGYQGVDWPKLDLLWLNAFGIRYGLFTSAPLLALALYPPAWLDRRLRLVGGLEAGLIFAFMLGFFLFTAANQFSRMQFNTGVRHLVPVTPFLFLIVAGVLRRLPLLLAASLGLVGTYWSWCLAMYRDVEQGWGIFEALIQVTTGGLRLPWLTTLVRMGYFPPVNVLPIFILAGAVLWILWKLDINPFKTGKLL